MTAALGSQFVYRWAVVLALPADQGEATRRRPYDRMMAPHRVKDANFNCRILLRVGSPRPDTMT